MNVSKFNFISSLFVLKSKIEEIINIICIVW